MACTKQVSESDGVHKARRAVDCYYRGRTTMALRQPLAIALLTFGIAAQPPLAHAGKLRKVWEVDLKKSVQMKDGGPNLPIFALRFSPDGRKLAVIADMLGARGTETSRLLVLDWDHPVAGIKEFKVRFGAKNSEGGQLGLNFGWSPSGEIIYAAESVVNVGSGRTCEGQRVALFIRDDLAISRVGPFSPSSDPSHFAFFDAESQEHGRWEVPEGWIIDDVSTDRGLLSIWKTVNNRDPESLVVDPFARKVLQRWPGRPGQAKFADSGKAICRGGDVWAANRVPAVCWSVDTGQEIARTPRANGIEPIATAARATRVVVSDYRRQRKILSEDPYGKAFTGRVVWDFGTGKELVSWHPEDQTYGLAFLASPRLTTEPVRFTISPDGQYIAEGGSGIIRLYKVEP